MLARYLFASVLVVLAGVADALGQSSPAASNSSAQRRVDVEWRVMFWGNSAAEPVAPDGATITTDFLLRRARVVIQARLSDALTAFVQAGQDNVGATLLTPDGRIGIKDAYVNYRVTPAFQIAAGQFKVPFLRADLESGFNQLLVDRGTLPTLRPAREGSRDLGVMTWGNIERWQYRLAAFDGSDQAAANGSHLRLTARIAKNWFTAEPGFGYTGTFVGTTRVLQLAAQADVQSSRLDARDDEAFRTLRRDYRAWAVEGFVEQPIAAWAVTADAAWVNRRDDYADLTAGDRHIAGYYVESGILLPPLSTRGRVQIGARREAWRAERAVRLGDTSRTVVGGTYFFHGHSRKIQADYTVKREVSEVSNDEFRASLALVF